MDSALQEILNQEISQRGLPDDFMDTVEQSLLPVAELIKNTQQTKQKTLLVSFNGSQGSGKSTITAFLRLILSHNFKLFTIEVSLDDFYLQRDERIELSRNIHPLFITRGVPGTHDVRLATQTLDCLRLCSAQHHCKIPTFDKAIDDRKPEAEWIEVNQPVSIILFEGWCNHAPVESEESIMKPVNDLEQNEDEDAEWRRYANDQLEIYHQRLFSQADMLIHLQVPSFEKVYEWRGLQEKKLAQQHKTSKQVKSAVMDEQQLKRFIQHYERITRNCLSLLPEQADIVLKLNADHGIDQIKVKRSGVADV